MTITKDGKQWKLDFRPEGVKGKRIIKLFPTKGQALQYQNTVISALSHSVDFVPVDDRTLNDLISLWFDLHGVGLKSAKDRKARLLKLSAYLNNPVARLLSPDLFSIYRNSRLDSGISSSTLNHELGFLKALYSELKRLSVIDYDSLIIPVKKLRVIKTELSYLTVEQISTLMRYVQSSENESLCYIVKICLVTGARWSEAQNLTVHNCINQGFQFVDTKNGKNRFVPVDAIIFEQIRERLAKSIFKSAYWAYRVAFSRSGLTVSRGQLSHVLRHTFASALSQLNFRINRF